MGKKEEHESFVQNLSGSSSVTVFNVIACIAFFIFLDGLVRSLFGLHQVGKPPAVPQNAAKQAW
jgi:hypothetical protein